MRTLILHKEGKKKGVSCVYQYGTFYDLTSEIRYPVLEVYNRLFMVMSVGKLRNICLGSLSVPHF